MYFSTLNDNSGGKAGKLALVAGLHALVAVGVMNAMNSKAISLPQLQEDLTVMLQPEVRTPPPPPPEPPRPMPQVAPPEIVVPQVEVDVPPPLEAQVRATVEAEPAPPQAFAQGQAEAPPAPASTNTGEMRSAVLADASGCAKPEYPARAARNGETGTVTLALLVGADGRVQSSRVQQSSGSRDLDRAAVSALSMCQFKPAMVDGVPQAGWGRIAYVWTLE